MIATTVLDQLAARAAHEGVQRVVVGAIVQCDDRILLLQRRHGLGGGALELPTGVVSHHETLAQAVLRTMAEQTGLTVTDIPEYVGSFDYPTTGGLHCRQINFAVTVAAAEPVRLAEHHRHRWLSVDAELPVTRAVREVFRKYRNIQYV